MDFQVESIRGNKIERRSNPEDQVLKYRNDILKSLKSYKDLRTNENQLKFTVNPIIAFPNINSYEFKDQGFEEVIKTQCLFKEHFSKNNISLFFSNYGSNCNISRKEFNIIRKG